MQGHQNTVVAALMEQLINEGPDGMAQAFVETSRKLSITSAQKTAAALAVAQAGRFPVSAVSETRVWRDRT